MPFLEPVTLRGPHASLVPLSSDHHDALVEAVSDGELWKLWYTAVPKPETMAQEIERRLGLFAAGGMQPFTVLDADGRVARVWRNVKVDGHADAVLAAARANRVRRFLHCSTESILFDYPGSAGAASAAAAPPAEAMPGAYTRSKALAEARAMAAAADGFPVVVGTPTMPIGPHDSNLTPPSQMLRHFLDSRVQLYLDFIVNLVDVRDVATGLFLAMERGKVGGRYVFGGESLRLSRILELMAAISGRKHVAISVPGRLAELSAGMLEFISDHLTKQTPSGTAEGVRIARSASDLSIDRAKRELGYAPRPIEPTLRETIAFLLDPEPGKRLDEKQHPFRTAAE